MTTDTPTSPPELAAANEAETVVFPQHAAKPAEKPRTIATVLEATQGMTPSQIMAVLAAEFPDATVGEVTRAIAEYAQRASAEVSELKGEGQAMEDVAALCAPVFERGEAGTVGEALRLLADQGDEHAAAYLAQIAGPDQQEFKRLLNLAVAEDPYWSKDAVHGYRCMSGATHTTPQEPVAAYRRNHGLG